MRAQSLSLSQMWRSRLESEGPPSNPLGWDYGPLCILGVQAHPVYVHPSLFLGV